MFLCDFGEQLNEVEGPHPPRKLLRVGEAIEPRLKFVENQRRGRVLEHLQENGVARNVRFVVTQSLPFSSAVSAVRVVFEEQIPKMLVVLAMQTVADHMHL